MGVNGSCACRMGPQFPTISQVFAGSVNPLAVTAADAFDPAFRNCAFEVRDFIENESKCGCLKPLSITAIEILYGDNWVCDSEKSCIRHNPSTQGLVASYECQLSIKFPLLQQIYLKTRKSSCKRPKLWESDKKQYRAPHPIYTIYSENLVLGSDRDALEMRSPIAISYFDLYCSSVLKFLVPGVGTQPREPIAQDLPGVSCPSVILLHPTGPHKAPSPEPGDAQHPASELTADSTAISKSKRVEK